MSDLEASKMSVKYAALGNDSISPSEDGSLTVEEELNVLHERRIKSLSSRLRIWRISTVVCLAAIFALALLLFKPKSQTSYGPTDEGLFETKLYRDIRYMSLDHDSDYLWQEALSPLYGVIDGDPDHEDRNGTFVAISMFHQLHCVAAIRRAFQDAVEGQNIGHTWKDGGHWPHCLDYLRRIIQCNADATIERPLIDPEAGIVVVDGAEDTRYCRDTRPLYELWKSKNRYHEYSDPEKLS